MKEELQEKGLQIIDKLLVALDSGIDSAPEAMSTLIDSYSKYYLINAFPAISASFCVGTILGYILIVKNINKILESDDGIIGAFALFLLVSIPVPFFIDGILSMMSFYVAPHAAIIEMLRK